MSEPQPALGAVLPADSRYLRNTADIVSCLKQLRDRRSNLSIRIDRNDATYQCKLLDVGENSFLIEDIHPRSGIAAIKKGKQLSLSARAEGLFVFIEKTKLLKMDAERGIPYFELKLPTSVLSQQRRRAARFRLPLRVSASGARISFIEEEEISGRIIDISAGGCRAEFELPAPWPVRNDDCFDNCAITIPKLLELRGQAVIRHFHENKHSQKLVCGIELAKMDVTDRRRLEHFIQTISKNAESV
ncbi:MAG: PilZ domain-containing protein [bacterium]